MERTLSPRELRAILSGFGVSCDESRGKGSHWLFSKVFEDGKVSMPIPSSRKDLAKGYVRACRRKFRLTVEDGGFGPGFLRILSRVPPLVSQHA